jgi:type II secretory pathway pseudopilin PulG
MKCAFRDDSGFTIAEYVMASAILLIVSIAIMGTLAYASTASTGNTRHEEALSLANQRLEQARNVPYDSVGTTNGYPTGTIPGSEDVGDFTVVTDVVWAIDPVSNLSSCKTIQITVSWETPRQGSVSITSNIAGKSTIANAGDVKVLVVDADTGAKLQGASISVQPSTGPKATRSTDASGSVRWGKVPAGALGITGTCPGYALDVAPLSGATVIAGQLNTWTIQAVKPSTAAITVLDSSKTSPNNKLAGVTVTLVGPSGTLTAVSNSSGVANFDGLLKGTYSVTGALTGYSPSATSIGILLGGQGYAGTLTMNKQASLTITVKDQDGAPVGNLTLSGVTAPKTDANGVSVVSNITPGTYTVTAALTGYTSGVGTVTIATGQDATLALVVTKTVVIPGTLYVDFKFASTDSSSKTYTVYIYDAAKAKYTSFSVKNSASGANTVRTTLTGVPLGWYWGSILSTYDSAKAAKANQAIVSGGNATISMTKSN